MFRAYSWFLESENDIFRYIFSTAKGLRYSVYFLLSSEYFDLIPLPQNLLANGYTFGIARMGEDEEKKCEPDFRIKHTIAEIINDFFIINPDAVLLVNYDDYDGKQEKRFVCFNKWFTELNAENVFYKEDAMIVLPENDKVFLSVIFQTKNNSFEKLLHEFHETKDRLIEEK